MPEPMSAPMRSISVCMSPMSLSVVLGHSAGVPGVSWSRVGWFRAKPPALSGTPSRLPTREGVPCVGVTTPVTYQVQALRSTTSGAPAEFTVKFGVGGSGQMTASVMGAGNAGAAVAPKLAA